MSSKNNQYNHSNNPDIKWLFSAFTWSFIAKTLSIISALVINILLVRILTPEEVGTYFLIQSIVTFAAIVARFGLAQTIVRLIAESMARNLPGRVRATLIRAYGITMIGTIIVSGSFYLGVNKWLGLTIFNSILIVSLTNLIALWIAVLAFQTPVSETFRGLLDVRMASFLDGVLASSLFAISLGVLWFFHATLYLHDVVSLNVLVIFSSLALGSFVLAGRLRTLGHDGSITTGEVISISSSFFVTNLVRFFISSISLWIVGAVLLAEDVAIYGAAFKLVTLVMLPLNMMNAVVMPLIANLNTTEDKYKLQNILRGTATLSGLPAFIILLTFIIFGRDILGLIYGEFYMDGALILSILSIGGLIFVWTGSCGNVLAMTGHQYTLMRLTIITGVGTAILAWLAVRWWGATGVALAVTFGCLAHNLAAWLLAHCLTGLWTHAVFEPRIISQTIAYILRRSH